MRIPYLGLLALGSSQNPDQHFELEKQVIEQLEKGTIVDYFFNNFFFTKFFK